jgi:hypothetical protein
MLGLIFKLLGGFALFVAATLFVLNVTDVAKPGTITVSTPDVAPCRRAVELLHPVYVEVRWVWHAKAYGWGCFYELEDGEIRTIAPMPK